VQLYIYTPTSDLSPIFIAQNRVYSTVVAARSAIIQYNLHDHQPPTRLYNQSNPVHKEDSNQLGQLVHRRAWLSNPSERLKLYRKNTLPLYAPAGSREPSFIAIHPNDRTSKQAQHSIYIANQLNKQYTSSYEQIYSKDWVVKIALLALPACLPASPSLYDVTDNYCLFRKGTRTREIINQLLVTLFRRCIIEKYRQQIYTVFILLG
jgi:hypothetical protein